MLAVAAIYPGEVAVRPLPWCAADIPLRRLLLILR